ncbi:MAG: bifunctional metallophosphatase/5'-nucleotidase [Deltaproteobacteria bacterium]|nr:bifunctional metallophosphatase/5'-nucleotidase [Deltaproteobacteria bacterium]
MNRLWMKGLCFCLICWGAGAFSGCSDTDSRQGTTAQIAVMVTGDLESRIVPQDVSLDGETLSLGGLARIAAAAKEVRGAVDGSLLLSAGNDVLGSFYYIFEGEPEMRGMEMAGYDVVTPGTHEFDYGAAVYGNALGFAPFDVTSGNLEVTDGAVSARILPYVIKEIAGVRVGIFGLSAPNFALLCNPTGGGVRVDPDIISIADRSVAELKLQACDLVIGLTHMGLTWARELARGVEGIDIILDGYNRAPLYETMENTLIVQEGSGGEYLAVLDFTFQDGRIQNPSWKRILMDSGVGSDPEIQDLMETYMAAYEQGLSQEIGESLVDLDGREESLRRGETNLGDLVADSWKERFPEADISLVNSGSIRGKRVYPAGPLTYLTVNEILPFQGRIMVVEMTGADILRVLEISASAIRVEGDGCQEDNRAPTGGFLQVGGLEMTLDLEKPCFCGRYSGKELAQLIDEGSRVSNVSVLEDDSRANLDPAETYRVLVNAYTSDGGDGQYPFLKETLKRTPTTTVTTDVLADFIIRHTPIAPEIDGRITQTGSR